MPTILLSIFSEESWQARMYGWSQSACRCVLLFRLVIRFGQGTAGESGCRMLEPDCLWVEGWWGASFSSEARAVCASGGCR